MSRLLVLLGWRFISKPLHISNIYMTNSMVEREDKTSFMSQKDALQQELGSASLILCGALNI